MQGTSFAAVPVVVPVAVVPVRHAWTSDVDWMLQGCWLKILWHLHVQAGVRGEIARLEVEWEAGREVLTRGANDLCRMLSIWQRRSAGAWDHGATVRLLLGPLSIDPHGAPSFGPVCVVALI